MRGVEKIYLGTPKQGIFKPENPQEFKRAFYVHEGKQVEVIVRRYRKKRSGKQNKYLWKVVYGLIAEATGHTEEEIHEAMGMKFLLVHGDKMDTIRSTTDLSTVEFIDYYESIQKFAIEDLNCYIPGPNEVSISEYEND